MRRFLLVAVMCGAASVAQAADMPDLPFLRGSFTEGLSTTAVNWQGFYVGGQAGYGSSDENFAGAKSDHAARLLDHTVDRADASLAMESRSRKAVDARRRLTAPLPATTRNGTTSSSASKLSYMHGKFGGTSRATKARSSAASALSDGCFHSCRDVECIGVGFRFRTWRRSAPAPLTRGVASCPMCSPASRSGKADISRIGHRLRRSQRRDTGPFTSAGDIERHGCQYTTI